MKPVASVVVLALLLLSNAVSQAPQQPSNSGPSPQQAAMGYFAGDWTLQGTAKISPTSPSAPFKGTERGEWVQGNYFLETHTKMSGPMGDLRATRVMEYNPQKNLYAYNVYNSLGEHNMATGEFLGNTWVWNAEEQLNGLTTKGRYTITIASPTSYTFKSEVANPNGGWATVMEGKATRAQ
jgi:hypothetical protein